ncbi:MAG TPA: nitroreductase/quinone reductase family protein [Actinomycetota bacterium]
MKRRVVNALAKHVANPVMRRLAGRIPGWALLETTGRRSGRAHQIPVGDGLRGDAFWIVAEHGRHADWVRNVEADPRVRIRVRGRWRTGTAHILEDDDPRERLRRLGGVNPWVIRVAGTEPLTVRVDLDPAPPRPGSVLRDGLVAGLVAGAVAGAPSGFHALRHGYLLDLLRAPGALVAPRAGAEAQLALTVPVHAVISAGWGVVLASALPRRATALWGAAGGVVIATLDIVVIGSRIPVIRRLPLWPQVADHVAFGTVAGGILAALRDPS